MTGISSSVGLISGIDYTSLVSQLIAIDGIPRDNLQTRTDKLISEESAWTNLMAKFLTTSYMIANLNKVDAFRRCEVSSSNESVLRASKSGTPIEGTYTFTPIQVATSQQTVAKGVASDTEALGKSGTITIGRGWSLENDIDLSNLNGGDGVSKGYIRITDGSGARATIDLRSCTTMNDILEAINGSHSVDVYAELDGDRLKLTDMSGGDPTKVAVQEVSNGKTAASLGLLGATADDDGVLQGNSIYYLGENMSLDILNDGNGVVFEDVLHDLIFTCKDGTRILVDFNYLATTDEQEAGAPAVHRELTVGDLIDTINNTYGNGGKIVASIGGPDGKSLVITDTTLPEEYLQADVITVGEGEDAEEVLILPDGYSESDYEVDDEGFVVYKGGANDGQRVLDPDYDVDAKTTVQQAGTNSVLRTLGFIADDRDASQLSEPVEFDGVLTSRALIGSLDSPLVSSLNGGYGLGGAAAGAIEVQDRAGNTATIEFTDTELRTIQSSSLSDAVKLINAKLADASVGVRLELNDAKTGLQVVDTTGRSDANLIFRDKTVTETIPAEDEDGEATTVTTNPNIAGSLGLNIDAAKSSVDGKSLNLQIVSHSTKLSDLNGGKGVTLVGGRIQISDSAGKTDLLIIDSSKHTTLGDIIRGINNLDVGVIARINDTGDGIVLEDIAGGDGNFSCMDANSSSKICADLKINQTVTGEDRTADGKLLIDGSTTYTIEVEETDSLEDIRVKINALGGNFSASVIVDGSSTPYRLAISGTTTGQAGAMNIDLSCLGLTTENMAEAQDAKLVYGDVNSNSSLVLTSSTNTFKNVINGIDLTVAGTSTSPITISSEKTSTDVKASLQMFVENYNTLREQLNTDMYFDTTLEAGNILHGNTLAIQMDSMITDMLLKTVEGIPGINSLRSLGITINSNLDTNGDLIATNKQTNKLTFDEDVFDALWESNPEGVEAFFFREVERFDEDGESYKIKVGWAEEFGKMSDALVQDGTGKIPMVLQTLDTKITQNEERIEYLNARLAVKEQQMLNKFYAMEQAMAQMSTDMTTISSLASTWSQNYSSTGSY